jgi:hypothetical protein
MIRIFSDFREKCWQLSQKPTVWSFFAKNGSSLNKKMPIFSPISFISTVHGYDLFFSKHSVESFQIYAVWGLCKAPEIWVCKMRQSANL